MRFLIFGAGAIGSIFAGKLYNAGYDVTVLARNKRYEEIVKNHIVLREALSGKVEISNVKVINKLEPDDIYDYVLVVMQKTQVEEVLTILSQNASPNIIFVVNNPLGYEQWVNAVGKKRLMLGFPSAGGERRDGIVDYFIGRGLSRSFQTTTFGEYDGSISQRLKIIARAFNKAKIPSVTSKNMDAWQKTHVAMVTSIANALYMHNSDNYELSRHIKDIGLMVKGIKEGLKVIEASGFKITPIKLNYFKLPAFIIIIIFKVLMNTRIAEFSMAKHKIVARDEMRALQKEFDGLIKLSGVKTPAIDELREYVR